MLFEIFSGTAQWLDLYTSDPRRAQSFNGPVGAYVRKLRDDLAHAAAIFDVPPGERIDPASLSAKQSALDMDPVLTAIAMNAEAEVRAAAARLAQSELDKISRPKP